MICNSFVQHMHDEVEAGVITVALSAILMDISLASVAVSKMVNRNVFDSLVVVPETVNTHGEKQNSLDMQEHDIFVFFSKKG